MSRPQLTAIENMAASGTGAALAALFTNPLEVAKTRLQMQNELVRSSERVYKNGLDCIMKTWKSEGLKGVQRGLEVAVIRDGSKCFFRLGLYDPVLWLLHPASDGEKIQAPFASQLFAGGFSGMVSAIICNPLDIVKVRVQSSGGLSASHHDIARLNTLQVFQKVIREEGVIGLWKGTPVNILRSISFTSILMSVNSRVKAFLGQMGMRDGFERDAIGSFAGSLLGTFFMNPVDVIRTRIYNQPNNHKLYNGIMDAALKISRNEGVLAFWKGAFAHYCRTGPHTVLSFIFIGKIKRLIVEQKQPLTSESRT